MHHRFPTALLACSLFAAVYPLRADDAAADVVVYRATPAGVTAAVAAAREGQSVIVVEPTAHVGGVVAQGGLCLSDLGKAETIGGLSREFFRRVADDYAKTYGKDSRQLQTTRFENLDGARFEPRVAEKVYEDFLAQYPKSIRLLRATELASVGKRDGKIVSMDCLFGPEGKSVSVKGKVFIDASYTGDLLAKAGASYRVGREAKSEYGEDLAPQKADRAVQTYNYRITVTDDPGNRVAIEKPADWNPDAYEYQLEGVLKNRPYRLESVFPPYWQLPNRKVDANIADMAGKNWDYPEGDQAARQKLEAVQRNYSLGYLYFLQNDERVPVEVRQALRQWGLPKDEFADNGHFPREIYVREARRLTGEYVMKQSDLQEHRHKPDGIAQGSYAIDSHAVLSYRGTDGKPHRDGYMWDPVFPYEIPYRSLTPRRSEVQNLLVPVCLSATHVAWASIRMEPVFMMTGEAAGVAAAMAARADIPVQDVDVRALKEKLAAAGGKPTLSPEPEADFAWEPQAPAVGESVVFSYRPGEGAAEPAAYYWDLNADGKIDAQTASVSHAFDAPGEYLITLAVASSDGKRSAPATRFICVGGGKGGDIQLDSEAPEVVRKNLEKSISQQPFYGQFFFHDGNMRKGLAYAEYPLEIVKPGRYAIFISTTRKGGRSTNTPVTVTHPGGEDTVLVNQDRLDNPFGMVRVGEYLFEPGAPAKVRISNDGTHGYVLMDVVRAIWLGTQ